MKTPSAHESPRPPKAPRKCSFISRLSAWLTGTDSDALAFAPNYELRKLHRAALSLVLVSTFSMVASAVAITVIRGGFTPAQIPISVVIGLIVYVVDRVFLRRAWEDEGLEGEAAARGAVFVKGRRWLWWMLRGSISLILASVSAEFLDLVIFEQDTAAYIAEQHQENIRPLHDEVAKLVDGEIRAKKDEIVRIDRESDNLNSTARTVMEARTGPIENERAALLKDRDQVEKQLAEHRQNLSAEISGDLRHDGRKAVPGMGRRYAHAANMVNNLSAQLNVIETRLGKIDEELGRLRQNEVATGLPAEVQARLDTISEKRVALMGEVALMEKSRTDTINTRMQGDSRRADRPDGLLARGNALNAMASKSAWLGTQIWLIRLALVVLDLCAILGISIVRAPKSIVVEEVRLSDTAIKQSEARHKHARVAPEQSITESELAMNDAMEAALNARARKAEKEDAYDEQQYRLEALKKMRQANAETFVKAYMDDIKTGHHAGQNTGELP